jgi:hypothetical protein
LKDFRGDEDKKRLESGAPIGLIDELPDRCS